MSGILGEFRQQVREFCRTDLPTRLMSKSRAHFALEKDEYVEFLRALGRRGWAAGRWPIEFGGCAWTPTQLFVLEDELARAGCPWVIPFGLKYVGPVIYTFGDIWQKHRFLPSILAAQEWWAQGYSEPGAGSDLAALRMTATRDGDEYVVSGQKAWSTYGHWADWIFCLVRTSRTDRPQAGVSFLLIDMKSPGITVKPVRTMDLCHHVNEIWFDQVRVPLRNLVGREGDGWKLSKFLLANERLYGAGVGEARYALDRLGELPGRRRTLLEELELRWLVLETLAYQILSDMEAGHESGAEASMFKIRASELIQDVMEASVDALGCAGLAFDTDTLHGERPPALGPRDAPGIIRFHLYQRAATIYGGSNEIQRNIIARSVLGLPT